MLLAGLRLPFFVKDIGKEGLCKVEDKDDGFWIAFVDRQIAEKDRIARERDTKLLEEEYRSQRILQKQLQALLKLLLFLEGN